MSMVTQAEIYASYLGYPEQGKGLFFLGLLLKLAERKTGIDPLKNVELKKLNNGEVQKLYNAVIGGLVETDKLDEDIEEIMGKFVQYFNPNDDRFSSPEILFHLMAGYTYLAGVEAGN